MIGADDLIGALGWKESITRLVEIAGVVLILAGVAAAALAFAVSAVRDGLDRPLAPTAGISGGLFCSDSSSSSPPTS